MHSNDVTLLRRTKPAEPPSATRRIAVLRAICDRHVMAALTVLGLAVYLWHAPQAIDYPSYDEANYFSHAQQLLAGNFAGAGMISLSGSPLYIAWYALWYAALHTARLYPFMFAIAILLMGVGCYLVLVRFLHPALAWALALYAVIGAAPVVPQNGLYYLAAGVLWISLALVGKHPLARGLGLLGVLISTFLRPEYLSVGLLLLGLLALYEWRAAHTQPSTARRLRQLARVAPCYLPALLVLLLIAVLAAGEGGGSVRVDRSIPWSYTSYLSFVRPQGYAGLDSLGHPWVLFERDYGPVQPQTLPNILLVMARRPDITAPYLGYETERLLTAFGNATVPAWRYTYTPGDKGNWTAPFTIWNTWIFSLVTIELGMLVFACAFDLKRRGLRSQLPLRRNAPALLGVVSLVGLLPWLLLVNASQRFWMTDPLVLLGLGWALTTIGGWLVLYAAPLLRTRLPARRHLRIPSWLPVRRFLSTPWAGVAAILLLLALLPHPFAGSPPQVDAETIAFIRQHVPEHSTIVGAPLASLTFYLDGEGYHLDALEAGAYLPSPLVQAERSHPRLRYLLLNLSLPPRFAFPQSDFARWFADWQRTYPTRSWILVAQQQFPVGLKLYELVDGASASHFDARSYHAPLDRQLALGPSASSHLCSRIALARQTSALRHLHPTASASTREPIGNLCRQL